jgi:hypothetical protein
MAGHSDLTRIVTYRGEMFKRITAQKYHLQQYCHPDFITQAIKKSFVVSDETKCIVNLLYNSLSDGIGILKINFILL